MAIACKWVVFSYWSIAVGTGSQLSVDGSSFYDCHGLIGASCSEAAAGAGLGIFGATLILRSDVVIAQSFCDNTLINSSETVEEKQHIYIYIYLAFNNNSEVVSLELYC